MDDKMIKELEAILLKEKAEAEVQLRKMKENGSKTSLLEWTGNYPVMIIILRTLAAKVSKWKR